MSPLQVCTVEFRQPGDLGVLRGVFRGFSEEARTRGFPSPSLGGFGNIIAVTKYNRRLSDCLIGNIIGTYSGVGKVPLGSVAAPQKLASLTAAIGGIAVIETVEITKS